MTDRQFAYGGSCVGGYRCPATAAGFDPQDEPHVDQGWPADEPGFGRVADQYDLLVALELFERDGGDVEDLNGAAIHPDLRERGYETGTVDAETARECWLQAIDAQGEHYAHTAGEIVAEELGWA